MWDVLIVHTTMWPKVSVSQIKSIFCLYRKKIHASKSFWKIYPLINGQLVNVHVVPIGINILMKYYRQYINKPRVDIFISHGIRGPKDLRVYMIGIYFSTEVQCSSSGGAMFIEAENGYKNIRMHLPKYHFLRYLSQVFFSILLKYNALS